MPFQRQNPEHKLTRAEIQKAYRQRTAEARAEELRQKGIPAAPAIPTMPGFARWNALAASARTAVATMRDEMQEYFDSRSEAWQESDKGEAMQAKIENLEAALEALADLE